MNVPPNHFFCDLALADVNAFACSTNRLLCHGSIHGSFGKGTSNRQPANLQNLDAIVVSLEHLSSDALSDDYLFHLLFLSAEGYSRIWSGARRSDTPSLSKICVRRAPTRSPSTPRVKRSILERKAREYVVTPFDCQDALDHYVSYEYRMSFLSHFRGFIVRSDKHTADLYKLIQNHNLAPTLQYNVSDTMDGEMQVLGFSKQPTHATSAPHDRSLASY